MGVWHRGPVWDSVADQRWVSLEGRIQIWSSGPAPSNRSPLEVVSLSSFERIAVSSILSTVRLSSEMACFSPWPKGKDMKLGLS